MKKSCLIDSDIFAEKTNASLLIILSISQRYKYSTYRYDRGGVIVVFIHRVRQSIDEGVASTAPLVELGLSTDFDLTIWLTPPADTVHHGVSYFNDCFSLLCAFAFIGVLSANNETSLSHSQTQAYQ